MTNEMTAEEAVEILKYERDNDIFVATEYREKLHEALTKAIKALEAQPSEDDFVKHKKEVLERIAKRESEIDKYIKELEALEQQPCEDCISRQAAIDFIIDNYGVGFNSLTNGIRDYLPSVTPKRPKGKWIKVYNWNDGDICRCGIKCSECHTEYKHGGEMWHNPKFCPNCGSYNGGGEDANNN